MAASAGPVSGADAVFPIAASLKAQRFPSSKLYLLVVIGEIVSEEQLSCAIEDIEKGKKYSKTATFSHWLNDPAQLPSHKLR